MKVLNIEVPDALLRHWQEWLAPDVQPFFLNEQEAAALPRMTTHHSTPVLRGTPPLVTKPHAIRDTFTVWKIDTYLLPVWLNEEEFNSLPNRTRSQLVRAQAVHGRGAVPTVRRWSDLFGADRLRAQADGHRFVWWPSLIAEHSQDVLRRVISEANAPSRHKEVSPQTWSNCSAILPRAKLLAGTFAAGSGPNCFGTVMAAAGVADADEMWMHNDTFDEWLDQATIRGGEYGSPGTVLVWRSNLGKALHAAVTVGDGWVLEKSSQAWSSPRSVLSVAEVVKAGRTDGSHLERHSIR